MFIYNPAKNESLQFYFTIYKQIKRDEEKIQVFKPDAL